MTYLRVFALPLALLLCVGVLGGLVHLPTWAMVLAGVPFGMWATERWIGRLRE